MRTLLFAALLPATLAAQKGGPPTNVTAQVTANGVTIAWAPPRSGGAKFRIFRSPDPRSPGVEIVTKAIDPYSAFDPGVAPGTTYYYLVVADYGVMTAASAPVAVVVPALRPVAPTLNRMAVGVAQNTKRLSLAPAPAPPPPPPTAYPVPTAVTGIKVNGTTAQATIDWRPVVWNPHDAAVTYSIARAGPTHGDPPTTIATGLSNTTTYVDKGPQRGGFYLQGQYTYTIIATDAKGTSSVSGQATWTRPNPTCTLVPGQSVLAIEAPGAGGSIVSKGQFPTGAVIEWDRGTFAIANLVERSVAGSNAWTVVGSTCGTTHEIETWNQTWPTRFTDATPGIIPGTQYVYRLTAFDAIGNIGVTLYNWTAPNPAVVNILSAIWTKTATGTNVVVTWRYEPPQANPPSMIGTFWTVSSEYSAPVELHVLGCQNPGGCQTTFSNVPHGHHTFTIQGAWTFQSPLLRGGSIAVQVATLSAFAVVSVP